MSPIRRPFTASGYMSVNVPPESDTLQSRRKGNDK